MNCHKYETIYLFIQLAAIHRSRLSGGRLIRDSRPFFRPQDKSSHFNRNNSADTEMFAHWREIRDVNEGK